MGLIQLGRLERTVEDMIAHSPAYLDYQLRKYSPLSKTKKYLEEQVLLSHISKYVVDGEVLPAFNLLKTGSTLGLTLNRSIVFSGLFDVDGGAVSMLISCERWIRLCTK